MLAGKLLVVEGDGDGHDDDDSGRGRRSGSLTVVVRCQVLQTSSSSSSFLCSLDLSFFFSLSHWDGVLERGSAVLWFWTVGRVDVRWLLVEVGAGSQGSVGMGCDWTSGLSWWCSPATITVRSTPPTVRSSLQTQVLRPIR